MSNPFSNKAGKGKKSNPFSAAKKENPWVKAVTNGREPDPRHRTTPKERAAAVKAAEKAKGNGARQPKSVANPWVREAFDISAQLAELDAKIAEYEKQYVQQLKIQKKAKTVEEINAAFQRGDNLMAAVINLCAQRRRLAGGIAT